MMTMMYAAESLADQFEKNHQYLIINLDKKDVGYCSFEHFNDHKIQTKIHKIYLKSDCRGNGVGTFVLNQIKILSISKGITKMILNVNRYNQGAVKAYQKIGFEVVRTIDINIGNGYLMEDFVMEWNFTKC
jgi:ribosomal protein S18 acetylase RimI-like enzyme